MKLLMTVALVSLFLSNCAERDVSLGHGYRFVELSKGNGAIIDGAGTIIIYPNVTDYRVVGNIVIGQRTLAQDNMDPNDPRFTGGLGNFILDMSSGSTQLSVSEEEFERTASRNPGD